MRAEQEFIGGYRVKRHMWTGQDSQVLEVVDPASNLHFAMKLLLPEKARDSQARADLFHEAEMGLKFTHPNVIKIFSVCKDFVTPHFVMEFFPAGSLKVRIMHIDREMEFLREHCQFILRQWATALAFLNAQGYVHRDVKPDNLLVNGLGEARVIDFALVQKIPQGLGKIFRLREKAAGTMSYMSPEQIRGETLDGRADIYCFGASIFEVLTGRPPFRGSSPNDLLSKHLTEVPMTPCTLNPDVTKEFGDFVVKLLSKKREDRPGNFHEVLMQMRILRIFKSTGFKTPPLR